jgi:hypothetical protein
VFLHCPGQGYRGSEVKKAAEKAAEGDTAPSRVGREAHYQRLKAKGYIKK